MKFIENVASSWKFFSMQAMAAATTLQGLWMLLPDDLKSSVPPSFVQWLTLAILALGMIGRTIKQTDDAPNDQ
jgi:hypothetical protein